MEQKTAETWVKVFAVLYWLGTAALLLLGLVFIIGGSALGALFANTEASGLTAMFVALGAILGVLMLGFAVLEFFIGLGLWKHQNWARIVLLIFAWIGAVGGLIGIIGAFFSSSVVSSLLQNIVGLAIAVFEIWLFQFEPTTKGLFTAAKPAK